MSWWEKRKCMKLSWNCDLKLTLFPRKVLVKTSNPWLFVHYNWIVNIFTIHIFNEQTCCILSYFHDTAISNSFTFMKTHSENTQCTIIALINFRLSKIHQQNTAPNLYYPHFYCVHYNRVHPDQTADPDIQTLNELLFINTKWQNVFFK